MGPGGREKEPGTILRRPGGREKEPSAALSRSGGRRKESPKVLDHRVSKDGDLELANNNRPVSLLPAMLKICERVALNQFMAYMKSRKRLTEHQSGNKAQHSTETLNVMMTDKFLEAMNNKMLTLMVLLDLSKAFDSIDHAKLLFKLRSLGVSCTALEWFRSYMHDRQQYIRIGSEMSGMCQSTHGIPQGSFWGRHYLTFT